MPPSAWRSSAMLAAQAAQGNPEVVARVTGEITRLDTAQADRPVARGVSLTLGTLLVWAGRRYATRFLGRLLPACAWIRPHRHREGGR